jgi:hypothetical protein
MKFVLGDFNAKVGREGVFTPTKGNESLLQDSNNNGVKIVNFDTSTNPVERRRYRTETLINTAGLTIRLTTC